MPLKKFLKRSMTTAKKYVKKRYGLNKRSSGPKYGRIAQDVMMLKKMINAEKKSFQTAFPFATVGQTNFNSTGALIYDITPLLPQGSGADARTGNSVKLTSALYQFQICHQSNATVANKVVIEFWQNRGSTQDTATLLANTFDPATFSNVVDFNSPRDQNHFNDYILMRRVVRSVPADTVATSDLPTTTFDIPFKFNKGKGHHIRLVPSPSNNPVNDILNGQIFMTIRAANGNTSATATTIDTPIKTPTSGLQVRWAYKVWYYDN